MQRQTKLKFDIISDFLLLDFDQRRTNNNQQFGDNQQLFLGNIPHHASEEELKALFARFGTVVDLRILSKGSNKLPPGIRNPQNYGFITYEDAESVQNCLAHCVSTESQNKTQKKKVFSIRRRCYLLLCVLFMIF